MAIADSVTVNLERVLTIFEIIRDGGAFSRELLRFADRNEARTQVIGKRRCEDEAARLDTDNRIYFFAVILRRQGVHSFAQTFRVLEQGGDVIKVNAGFWEIRHFTNQLFEIVHIVGQLIIGQSTTSLSFNSKV